MKRFILILFALTLFSCTEQKKFIEIEFWTLQLSPTFDNYFNELINEYEKKNPHIKIKWVDIPYDVAIQKLLSAIIAGNPPDVINLSSDFLYKFEDINALVDLRTLYPEDTFKIFLPNALENCTINKKIVALPWYLNTYVLIYNKKLIRDANFDLTELPKNFSELVEFMKEYKKRTGKYAFFWNIGKDSYLPIMLESEGIKMINDDLTQALFDSEEAISLIDKWVELYRDGFLPRESIIASGTKIIEPYQSGDVAMVFTGPVFIKRIKINSPEIYKHTDVASVITGKTGKHELAAMSLSVLASSEHKKEASDFIFYLTNAENQLKFSKLTVTFPSVKEALKDSFFTKFDGTIESKARITCAKDLQNATRLRTYLQHPKFDELRDIFDEAIQNACLGKKSTREAIINAANEWNRILAEKY
ncbi:MAG: sugar ABC transporter substrate-binding protein [Ignavibacteria bacterium]|nr:sugar ABC transporter substrate-binding protein [Ignavibacteria bacterium]